MRKSDPRESREETPTPPSEVPIYASWRRILGIAAIVIVSGVAAALLVYYVPHSLGAVWARVPFLKWLLILSIIVIVAIFSFNKLKWRKTSRWVAGIGILLILVFLGIYYAPKGTNNTNGSVAVMSRDLSLIRVTISPAKPLQLVLKQGHRIDVWPEDESLVEHSWSRSVEGYILTLTAKKDTAVNYRAYMCTALMPCDSKPPI